MFTLSRLRRLLAASTLAALFFAPSAMAASDSNAGQNAQEVQGELQEAVKSVKNYAVEQRDETYEAATNALDTVDTFIERQQDRLSEAWSSMSESARAEYKDAMLEIRRKRSAAAEWLGSMKTSSVEQWEDMKSGFEKAFDDLSHAISDAESNAEAKDDGKS